MARKKQGTYDSYEKDMFDNPPAGPVGVHRGNRSVAARLSPYVVVIVVAALAGLLAWSVFSGEAAKIRFPWSSSSSTSTSASSSESSLQSETATKEATSTPSETASQTETQESTESATPSETATAEQTVNKATSVRVINGTGIQGYAAQQAAILQQAGYTSVTADNPSGSTPSATVVWYQNETDLATAQDVANTLGISNVQQVSGIASPIVVVLMS
ncbi:LytR C-terminal domain-containing protein [Bifidobacterium tsurumiense]|uniref:LytR C-terminal domain-containing protein n=1 Tax=Bifidobacterium tsurumiense TaxID=356829 RepID=UPI0012B396A3|nr:LytR C-terminal domain-containing protein [Bifidobacterium tsurumiense]MSS12854.1 LytR family transcriptional regulator [Bifidobacterium tsurumiense]